MSIGSASLALVWITTRRIQVANRTITTAPQQLERHVSHYRSPPNPLTSTARQAFPNNLTMPLAGRSLAVPGLGGLHRDDPTAFLALIDEVLASSRLPAGVHGGPEVAVVDLADASPDVVA